MTPPIGLQLYSVRDALSGDFEGVIRRIAQMGYVGVETAGMYGKSPQDAAKLFKELGFEICSSHMPLPLGDQKQAVIETMQALGSPRLIANFGPDEFKTRDKIRGICDLLNESAAVMKQYGVAVGYHNHWWEYEPFLDGSGYPYQVMLEMLDPSIFFQLDVYWVTAARAHVAGILHELGKRVPLLHIKDGPAKQDQPMLAVGKGAVDMKGVYDGGGKDAQWWIVELDACATDMLEAIESSIQYLNAKGFAHARK